MRVSDSLQRGPGNQKHRTHTCTFDLPLSHTHHSPKPKSPRKYIIDAPDLHSNSTTYTLEAFSPNISMRPTSVAAIMVIHSSLALAPAFGLYPILDGARVIETTTEEGVAQIRGKAAKKVGEVENNAISSLNKLAMNNPGLTPNDPAAVAVEQKTISTIEHIKNEAMEEEVDIKSRAAQITERIDPLPDGCRGGRPRFRGLVESIPGGCGQPSTSLRQGPPFAKTGEQMSDTHPQPAAREEPSGDTFATNTAPSQEQMDEILYSAF